VLEQMGKTGLPLLLVLRTDVVPAIDGHNRRFVVFVDDNGKAIVQSELLGVDLRAGELHVG
jgi:hypothetical protein